MFQFLISIYLRKHFARNRTEEIDTVPPFYTKTGRGAFQAESDTTVESFLGSRRLPAKS